MQKKSDRLCAKKGGSYSALKVDILDVVTWKKPDEGLLLWLFYQDYCFCEACLGFRRSCF